MIIKVTDASQDPAASMLIAISEIQCVLQNEEDGTVVIHLKNEEKVLVTTDSVLTIEAKIWDALGRLADYS